MTKGFVAFLLLIAVTGKSWAGDAPGARSVSNEPPAMNDARAGEGLATNALVRRVWDSGLYPYNDGIGTAIYWLDDSTLVFVADTRAKPASAEDAAHRQGALYVWRLGDKPQAYGRDPQRAAQFYRAARGTLCFLQRKADAETGELSDVLMKGPPGAEREMPPWKNLTVESDGIPSNGSGLIEDIDCEQFSDRTMAGRIYQTDAYRRYYLDRGPYSPAPAAAKAGAPVLMRSDGARRMMLPIPPAELGGIYSRAFDGYFWSLEESLGSSFDAGAAPDGFLKWKATNCLALWRIDPASGASARGCIPFGPWSGQLIDSNHGAVATLRLLPTTVGLFFSSTKYTDSDDPKHIGASGLYKIENGAVRRVLAGYLLDPTPSPNGCRVAFVFGPNWASHEIGALGAWTIAAIDLCS